MIPKLDEISSLEKSHQRFLNKIIHTDYSGDVESELSNRLIAATDNSIYQVLPQCILYPKNSRDISSILKLAAEEEFKSLSFTARGGGTGTNGQSLSKGIIVDVSKHMNRILEINEKEMWARVEPGVVLDQLNSKLKSKGVFFAPDLSPSNRATIGGMCNTDACGKGSRVYGKTSNHILELEIILSEGTSLQTRSLKADELEDLKGSTGIVGKIHRDVHQVVTENKDLVQETFPKLRRFLTGYNLAHVIDENGRFNLSYLIAGSEGTLAFVSELKVKLTPIPKKKKLILAKYSSFDDSLRAAETLVDADPAAIETVDDTIVKLAKEDVIWGQISQFFSHPDDENVKSVNLIEFIGDDSSILDEQVSNLCALLDQKRGEAHQAISYVVAEDEADINALWALRKKGVGLLGNRPGRRRPIPFVEDTVVPPENLAAYIREFREVLDRHGLDYGMFGHVDVGCLHVRPALDMKDESDERLIRSITDEVKNLVLKYGGVVWGEHGKGLRSEYMPEFFGEKLYGELRTIKEAFDPDDKLNPGKIASPASKESSIIPLDASPMRGQKDRQIPQKVQDAYSVSINCNGNGACFNFNTDDLMCPSYKQSRNRIHSPKGRAGLMREWLRQSSQQGYDASEFTSSKGSEKFDESDFSSQVYTAMNGCLSCKACSSLCPIKVNIPEIKSKFLHHYFSRYKRPFKDKLIASGEQTHHFFTRFPRIYNFFAKVFAFESIFKKLFGLIDSPSLSAPSYRHLLQSSGVERLYYKDIDSWPSKIDDSVIFIIPDSITAFYESSVFNTVVQFFQKLGLRPVVPEFLENGKALHVKGFLPEFKKRASETADHLRKLQDLGRPIIGIDPALSLVYREEYKEYSGDSKLKIQLPQEFLLDYLQTHEVPQLEKKSFRLLAHCGESSSIPSAPNQWQSIFAKFGLDLQHLKTGCCGMAGAFGHEVEHYQESKEIYGLSWQEKVEQHSEDTLVATGASCRSQVKRFSSKKLQHPLELLNQLMSK